MKTLQQYLFPMFLAYDEGKHKRGKPKNKGQYAPKGEAASGGNTDKSSGASGDKKAARPAASQPVQSGANKRVQARVQEMIEKQKANKSGGQTEKLKINDFTGVLADDDRGHVYNLNSMPDEKGVFNAVDMSSPGSEGRGEPVHFSDLSNFRKSVTKGGQYSVQEVDVSPWEGKYKNGYESSNRLAAGNIEDMEPDEADNLKASLAQMTVGQYQNIRDAVENEIRNYGEENQNSEDIVEDVKFIYDSLRGEYLDSEYVDYVHRKVFALEAGVDNREVNYGAKDSLDAFTPEEFDKMVAYFESVVNKR